MESGHQGTGQIPQLSVAGFLFEGGRLLLGLRASRGGSMDGRWELPGGKAESGEDARQALVREFREETGLQISPRRCLASRDFMNRGVPHRLEGWLISCGSGIDLPGSGPVHSEFVFFSRLELEQLISNAPDTMVDSDRLLLKELLASRDNFWQEA